MTAKAAMIFVPWLQGCRGSGRSVAFEPGSIGQGPTRSGGIEPGRERTDDRKAEPLAELQVQGQRQHIATARANDRYRDENTHQRLTGDEAGSEQHAVTLRAFTVSRCAGRTEPALDQVRYKTAREYRHRKLERQVNSHRDRKHRRTECRASPLEPDVPGDDGCADQRAD